MLLMQDIKNEKIMCKGNSYLYTGIDAYNEAAAV